MPCIQRRIITRTVQVCIIRRVHKLGEYNRLFSLYMSNYD